LERLRGKPTRDGAIVLVRIVGSVGVELDLVVVEVQVRRLVGLTIGFGSLLCPSYFSRSRALLFTFTYEIICSSSCVYLAVVSINTSALGKSKQYLFKHSALSESVNSKIPADLLIRDFGDSNP
jgi:hypothetical protein